MGLLDSLKKQKQSEAVTKTDNPVQEQTERYLGDLNKTDIIYNLVKTPKNERDEKWQQAFLENIGQASFRCGDPQVITGPDGFLYFQLFLPEPNKKFQCFVIDKMKDDFLLTSGFGVVINPTSNGADWVLSYGDILNFHLNREFYTTKETAFSRTTNDETLSKEEQVMIGQPSETILPKQTRDVISNFLKLSGVNNPKLLLMMRHIADGKGVSQDLVFNLTPQTFDNENTYRGVMQTLSWYLPRHYSLVGMNEKIFENEFLPI